MAKRTTHRSSKGKKLYAVRSKKGAFKDIQSYKKAHGSDVKRKAKAERAPKVRRSRAAQADYNRRQMMGIADATTPHRLYNWKRDPAVTEFMKTFRDFTTSHFGKRCKTVESGCGCCQMWKAYDLVDTMIV